MVLFVSTESRTARRSLAIRSSIVTAASNLIAERGAVGLTIDAVAERADVAIQTIYNRVGGRTDLLAAVTESAIEADRRYMDDAYIPGGTPVERIERAARAYASFAAENPVQFRMLADPPDDAGVRQKIADLVGEQNSKLASAIADGIADGSVRPDLPAEQAATVLWSMMNGVLLSGDARDGEGIDLAIGIVRFGLVVR